MSRSTREKEVDPGMSEEEEDDDAWKFAAVGHMYVCDAYDMIYVCLGILGYMSGTLGTPIPGNGYTRNWEEIVGRSWRAMAVNIRI